jgi:hypothetical protein
MVVRLLLLPFIFISLQGCPSGAPGSTAPRAGVDYIGYLPHRARLYAAALIASYRIGMALRAGTFAELMNIRGHKRDSLKGRYISSSSLPPARVSTALHPVPLGRAVKRRCKPSPLGHIRAHSA